MGIHILAYQDKVYGASCKNCHSTHCANIYDWHKYADKASGMAVSNTKGSICVNEARDLFKLKQNCHCARKKKTVAVLGPTSIAAVFRI